MFTDRAAVDEFEATLPEVFPDFAPGNFTWSDDVDGWVWTTFNNFQWDVNWSNPEVMYEYADIILFLANLGVEVLRLDAIAFMWKRLGTNCQNQPEVHSIAQALRSLARIACPALAFKAEAIVGPADLVHYLGQGAHYGKVSDIAYHNSLMVQIWSMLASGDVRLGVQALRALPPVPPTTAWVTYVRCHDDIGWAIDDYDAWKAGLNGWDHRRFLSDYYSGTFPDTPARGLVFQSNPVTGDRRISGTAASLVGLESALAAADGAAVDTGIARLVLAYALVMGWGGIPVVWMGDELAMLNDPDWADGAGARSRQPVGPPSSDGLGTGGQAAPSRTRCSSASSTPSPICSRCVGDCRSSTPRSLPRSARCTTPPCCRWFAGTRSARCSGSTTSATPGVRIRPRRWPLLGLASGSDAVSGQRIYYGDDGNHWLPPYGFRWLIADNVSA